MAILTRKSRGIVSGYISGYKREELIQKLGRIEHAAPGLLEKMCDDHCRYPLESDSGELESICEACPVRRVMDMIE